jgi:hypothetical protein
LPDTTEIASIIIDALANTLLYGPVWCVGLYYASASISLVVGCDPAGMAWMATVFSPDEMRRLFPKRAIKSLPSKPSNIVPFRKRGQEMDPVNEPMEAAE